MTPQTQSATVRTTVHAQGRSLLDDLLDAPVRRGPDHDDPREWPWRTSIGRTYAALCAEGTEPPGYVRYCLYHEFLCGPHSDEKLALRLPIWRTHLDELMAGVLMGITLSMLVVGAML